MGFFNKLWHWITGRGWTEGDEPLEPTRSDNSQAYATTMALGNITKTQAVNLNLIFYDVGDPKTDPGGTSVKEIKYINITKDNSSGSFIYKDNNVGIINYEVTNQSFDWSPHGILVSPASSVMLDEVFYKTFGLKLDVSKSKAFIKAIDIEGDNTTASYPIQNTIFSLKNEAGYTNQFSEKEIALFKENSEHKLDIFAGKTITSDSIDYPISNNIFYFDYYTKYDIPEYITQNYKDSSNPLENYYTNEYNKKIISSTGETTNTAPTTTVRRSSRSYRTTVIKSDSESITVNPSTQKDKDGNDIQVNEYAFNVLADVNINIKIYLVTKELNRITLDIFPPAITDKISFIPDIKNITALNIIQDVSFNLNLKTYFKLYNVRLSFIEENKESPTGESIYNKTIVPLVDKGSLENTQYYSGICSLEVDSLEEINVYNYIFSFTGTFQTKNENDTDSDTEAIKKFLDITLEIDQSGDDKLSIILNDIYNADVEDYECAIKVFSNNTSIGRVSNEAFENILIGVPLVGGTYEIARYKLKEDCKEFGNVHVFYGDLHLRKSGGKLKYSTQRDGDELVVYIKYDPFVINTEVEINKAIEGENLIFLEYICVNMDDVIELDFEKIDKSNPIKITNTPAITQNSNVVFASSINIPLINFSDVTVFIDKAQSGSKLQHYTNITKINTNDTVEYLGVRAYKQRKIVAKYSEDTHSYSYSASTKLFDSDISSVNINGLTYNTNAQLVLLTPYPKQETIYSFRNGIQTMQLNKSTVGFNYDKENKKLSIRDVLPDYYLSYEYIVDGKESNNIKDYNLRFNGLREIKGWTQTELPQRVENITTKTDYLFTVSYMSKYTPSGVNDGTYYILDGIKDNEVIYGNIYFNNYSLNSDTQSIDKTSTQTIYEEKYSSISLDSGNDWKDDDNIYEKVDSYNKLSVNSVKLTDFTTAITNYYNRIENNNSAEALSSYSSSIYYKYSSISKEYNEYTLDDIKGITSVPYNLYYKCSYYLKLSRAITEDNRSQYSYKDLYKKEYNDTLIPNPKIEDKLVYAHYENGFTYMPLYLGIKYDGSVQYYSDEGYYLIDFENLDYRKEPRPIWETNSSHEVYLKQNYSNVESLTEDEVARLSLKGYKFYKKVNSVKYIPISDIQTIYDLDLSGDVVYADSDKKIISKKDIDYIYYEASTDSDQWGNIDEAQIIFSDGVKKIKDDGNNTFILKNLNTDKTSGFNGIYYIVDFSGDYYEVSQEEVMLDVSNYGTTSNFYINKEGYNKFEVSANTFLPVELDTKYTNKGYLYYGYNFKFYLKGKSKIPIDKIKEYIADNKKIYINADRLFYNATIPNGLEVSDEQLSTGKISNILLEIYAKDEGNHTAGTIKDSSIKYYHREPQYIPSYDIHNNINKKYYTIKNYIVEFGEITLADHKDISYIQSIDDAKKEVILSSSIDPTNHTNPEAPNSYTYIINYDSLKFYKQGTYAYTLTHLTDSITCAYDIINYIGSDLAQNGTGENTYSYEVFMRSKFFYSSYTVNNGINIAKDGSYYTNISVFDGKTGITTKSLYLTPHIYTVTNYRYTTVSKSSVPVTKDMDLSQVSEAEYKNYYVQFASDGRKMYLNETANNNTIQYWQDRCCNKNNKDTLFTEIVEEKEIDYNGQKLSSYQYQFFDIYKHKPYIVDYNGNKYGLIFNQNPYEETSSDPFLIKQENFSQLKRFFGDSCAVATRKGPYLITDDEQLEQLYADREVSQKVYEILGETYKTDETDTDGDIYTREDANFLKAKHYYENLPFTTEISKAQTKYTLSDYHFEVVPLQEFIYKSKGIDDNIFQNRYAINYELKEKESFELANSKKIKFTGTYTWIPPEFSYISTYELTKNDYNSEERTYEYHSKKIISKSGYWSKDYIEEDVPFKISSYNYYPKNEISSVNITYNFIPNSYILSSEVYYPKITYDYVVNDIYEYYKYTYIINGIEKDYPLDGEIILNPDNTYSGIIHVLDKSADEDGSSRPTYITPETDESQIKVKLYKKLDLSVKSDIKNIVHQDEHITYNWFAYTQATPLTNEKIPFLYKKEIIPAHTKKIQYWNKDTNSYAIKEIMDSYSYYSYEYTYEVIPFKVASYIYTDDLRISNFPDLGAYIIALNNDLKNSLSEQAQATQKLNTTIDETVGDLVGIIKESSNSWNNNFTNHANEINSTLNNSSNVLSNNLSSLSTILDTSIDDFNKNNTNSLKSLTYTLSTSINDESKMLNSRLDEGNSIVNSRLDELKSYIHSDLIGSSQLDVIQTNTKANYVYYQKERTIEMLSQNTQTNTLEGNSIGKLLRSSMFGNYEHSKITYNADGTFTKTVYSGEQGIAEILANFTTIERVPEYNQFMVKLVPALFANVDFENNYEVQYDSYGNVISTQKRNPLNVAKASIYRADVLWTELKKKGIVE